MLEKLSAYDDQENKIIQHSNVFATNSSKLYIMLKKSTEPPFHITAIILWTHLFINKKHKAIYEYTFRKKLLAKLKNLKINERVEWGRVLIMYGGSTKNPKIDPLVLSTQEYLSLYVSDILSKNMGLKERPLFQSVLTIVLKHSIQREWPR